MGRKKGTRATTLIRSYVEFAGQITQASAERGITVAEFCDRFLTTHVEAAHRDYIATESKRLESPE